MEKCYTCGGLGRNAWTNKPCNACRGTGDQDVFKEQLFDFIDAQRQRHEGKKDDRKFKMRKDDAQEAPLYDLARMRDCGLIEDIDYEEI
jgi:RecJ-like exonuclease